MKNIYSFRSVNLQFLVVPFFLGLLLQLLSACASQRVQYSPEAEGWSLSLPDSSIPLEHSLFLIGDAGNAQEGQPVPPALSLLASKLRSSPANSSVLFLGDNIYPDGMAPKSVVEERRQDEYRLRAQLDAVGSFSGQVFFIPGNHDWYTYGIDGLKRQRNFIEDYLDRDDVWFPDPGCNDPVEIELGANTVLIIIDSQWWLANWKGEPEINKDCTIKSREIFKFLFEDAIKGNRDRNVVVAMHHPLYSNGPHGGQFTLRQHLFPLTEINSRLWVPLPLIGSLYPLLRSTVGSKQDLAHPDYRDLKEVLMESSRKNGRFIFVAGHEHGLQYTEADDQYFITSGGGSKHNAMSRGLADFVYGSEGFSQLDFYADGSVWVQFWVPEDEGRTGRVVFRKKVKDALVSYQDKGARDFEFYENEVDAIELPLGEYDFSKGKFGRLIWGDHYRDAYAEVLTIPVLDLATFQGGVKPVKRGGGYQTNSLRLEAPMGRQFTMRSLDKDPSRLAVYPLNQSRVVLDLIKDTFSSTHPLSALPIPPMAAAVDVYHTNPAVYYVPPQPLLENFNEDFGGHLYLVEERPDDDNWREMTNFGKPRDLISTEDVIEEIHDKHDHRVDQNWVLRSRLFDLVIGDWDRHDDQWRWAEIKEGGATLYRPIPRDRDQAFARYDGLIFMIARQTSPAAKPLRPYSPNPQNIWWSNFGCRHFDNTFLTEMEWSDWEREVRYIQEGLTDEVVDSAFRDSWPESLLALDGDRIIRTLKSRRNKLEKIARNLYEYRSRKVDVVGTDEKDLFVVERLDDQRTRVTVFDTNKEGEKEEKLYERTFLQQETREIVLYGLDDDDIFRLTGQVDKGIRVRLVGGLGDDTFIDHSMVSGRAHKTMVYDVKQEKSVVEAGAETRLRFSANPSYNIYNRKAKHYDPNFWQVLPSLAFNPDDGFLLGASASFTHHGFKKTPYAGKHLFGARYAFATNGIDLLYRGEFIDVLGDWEISLNAVYRTPLYADNFYGLGNETANLEDSLGLDYNRVRQERGFAFPALMRIINSATRLYFGPTYEYVKVERTEGRFIDDYANADDSPLDPDFFRGQQFLGVRFIFDFSNLDDPAFPSRGLKFYVDGGWRAQLNGDQHFPFMKATLSAFQPLDRQRLLVFGTRLGFEHIFAENFQFYHAPQLGGTGPWRNLRGYRRDRFVGQSVFFQNFDLRWHLFESSNQVLPFSMGAFAGFDYGRVWLEGERSKKWHYGYGGGLFFIPLEMLSFGFSMFRGDDEVWRFAFGGSFMF